MSERKYNAVKFDMPVGAVIYCSGGGELRHIGNGEFVTPWEAGKLRGLVEGRTISGEPADEAWSFDLPGTLFYDTSLEQPGHRRAALLQINDPEQPGKNLTDSEVCLASGIDPEQWAAEVVADHKSKLVTLS